MFPASKVVPIDPDLWRACAGSNVNIPEIGAKVYYFPEGHAEQQCGSDTPSLAHLRNIFPCRVLHVRYFIDRITDELSAAITLQQVGFDFRAPPRREGSRIESFMKVLTQSDANNGGGFSVPRQCAEFIFPPLNYQDDPPVQNLTISDDQCREWVFRHIYRGKPKRHLLTTGWSKFVNHKTLIGGDTIIFMRDSITRKMYIGIRRLRNNKPGANGRRAMQLSPRYVEEAAMRAARGMPFEVAIYPRSGMSDFVVNADLVDRALNFRWAVGMRVKMEVAADDPANRACLYGHVSFVKNPQECGSLWKIIQVTWAEPEHLQNVEMLNPWQVECLDLPAPLQRATPPNELLAPHFYHPVAAGIREPRSLTIQRSLLFGLRNQNLTSMQGVKHLSHVSNLHIGNSLHIQNDNTFQRSNMPRRITEVVHPTEKHNGLRLFGAGVGIPSNIMGRGDSDTIQLFGKHISVKSPIGNQVVDGSSLETYGSKVSDNDAEDGEGMELKTGSSTRDTLVEGNSMLEMCT